MRLKSLMRLLAPVVVSAMLFPAAPALAQVEPTADNALTCALIYGYIGDRGPAYQQLVTTAARLGQRSESDVRADLAAREPRLDAAVSDGRIELASFDSLVSNACPKTFGVAAATRGGAAAARTPVAVVTGPDPVQCAGIYRWLDAKYPPNAWGSTWAGDEMVRRAASAAGMSYADMDRRVGSYSPGTTSVSAQLDLAVQCQTAFDTPVPPGAVLAAAQNGDRPGIARGRNHYCTALSNDYDKNFPDISSIEWAIANNPQSAGDRVLKVMDTLKWYLDAMGNADCPAEFVEPRVNAFGEFTNRATNAVNQAKQRLEREGPWW